MEADIFQTNLNALQSVDLSLCNVLRSFTPNQKYEVFLGNNDVASFNIIDKARQEALYKTKPIDEVMRKNDEFLSYTYYPFLYLYGLGNGVLIRLLLNPQRERIVVFEPELEIIFIVLNLLDFSSEIKEGKLTILHTKNIDYMAIDTLFNTKKRARIFVKTYDLIMTNSYYEHYSEDILRINKAFIKAIEHLVVSVGNDAKDSIIGISNHIQNLPDVLHSPDLTNLIDVLQGRDSVIIVSTGPSLYKQLPLLKQIAPYATLFCIDASFPILHKHNIKPDVVFSLERVEATARFYTDTPLKAQEGVIFALTSIVDKKLKNAIKKGTLQYSLRPFGYTSMFGFHDYGYIGVGMSAANMAYELAVYCKFKRCIFIGQDLAFGEDGTSHSKEAIYGENEIKPTKDKVFVTKYGGGGEVESTKVWKLFLMFFEKDIANTRTGMEVINSTQGGARISGTKEMPFSEAIALIDTSHKKSQIKLTTPTKKQSDKNIAKAKRICLDIIKYGTREKQKIEKLFLDLAKELENIEKLNTNNKLNKINFKKLDRLSDRIDKVKNLLNDRKFYNYFFDAIQSYIFHQELDIAKVLVAYTANDEELKSKQVEWLYHHKYWLFSLAGGMDCVIEVVKQAMEKWE